MFFFIPGHTRSPLAASLVALLWAGSSAQAGGPDDPWNTSRLHPHTPSSFWEGSPGPSPCPAPSAVPDPLRLVDAIDLALCNNPRTRQSWAIAKASAADVGAARAPFLPNVDANVTLQRREVRNTPGAGGTNEASASVAFNYLLFDFGGRDAALEQARETLLAANWTHNATLQSVMLDAVTTYYLLYAAREAVDARLAAEKASQQSVDAARARLKAGTATRADVLQAQTAYSQAVLNRTQAQGDAANTEGLLASTLGLRPDYPMRIVPPIDLPAQKVVERSVGELIDNMRRLRPELVAAQAQVRAAESNIRVQQAAAKPSVSLFGIAGATTSSPGSDPLNGAIGLSVNIPIFTGFFNTYRIRAARDLAEAEAANRDRLESDLALEVWRSYQELRTQGQALVTATDLETSAQESYKVALARYRAGVGTVIDLLNAQSTLADASVQRIQARLQWNVSKAALARSIGVLDPALVGKVAGEAGAAPVQQ